MINYREGIRNIRINEYIKNYKAGDFYNQVGRGKKFSGSDVRAALKNEMPDKFMIEQLKMLHIDYVNKNLARRPSVTSVLSNESDSLSANEIKLTELSIETKAF